MLGSRRFGGARRAEPLDPTITPFDETRRGEPATPSTSSPSRRLGARLAADADRRADRHAGVHGARAISRRAARSAHRSVRVLRHRVAGADRRAAVQRRDARRDAQGRSSGGVAHIQAKLPSAVRAVLARGLDPDADEALAVARGAARRARARGHATGAAQAAQFVTLAASLIAGRDRHRNVRAERRRRARRPAATIPERVSSSRRGRPRCASALSRRTMPPTAFDAHQRAARSLSRALGRELREGVPAAAGEDRAPAHRVSRRHSRSARAAITTMLARRRCQGVRACSSRATCCRRSRAARPRRRSRRRACRRDQPRRGKILQPDRPRASRCAAFQRHSSVGASTRCSPKRSRSAGRRSRRSCSSTAGNEYVRRRRTRRSHARPYQRALASLPTRARAARRARRGARRISACSRLARRARESARGPATRDDAIRRRRSAAARRAQRADHEGDERRRRRPCSCSAHARCWRRSRTARRARNGIAIRAAYDEALRLVAEARKQFDAIGDVQRSAVAAAIEAQVYLRARRRPRTRRCAVRRAPRRRTRSKPRSCRACRGSTTCARGRVRAPRLHRAVSDPAGASRRPSRSVASRAIVKGRVGGENAASAVVVAWQRRARRRRATARDRRARRSTVDIVRVERDGTFAIHAKPDWAIMAETQTRRSTPRLVGDDAHRR